MHLLSQTLLDYRYELHYHMITFGKVCQYQQLLSPKTGVYVQSQFKSSSFATLLGLLYKKQTQLQCMSIERRMQTLRKCFCKVCLLVYILSCKNLFISCMSIFISSSQAFLHLNQRIIVPELWPLKQDLTNLLRQHKFAFKLIHQHLNSKMNHLTNWSVTQCRQ